MSRDKKSLSAESVFINFNLYYASFGDLSYQIENKIKIIRAGSQTCSNSTFSIGAIISESVGVGKRGVITKEQFTKIQSPLSDYLSIRFIWKCSGLMDRLNGPNLWIVPPTIP